MKRFLFDTSEEFYKWIHTEHNDDEYEYRLGNKVVDEEVVNKLEGL